MKFDRVTAWVVWVLILLLITFMFGVGHGSRTMFKQNQIELQKERESSFQRGVECGSVSTAEALTKYYREGQNIDVSAINKRAYQIGREYHYIK